MSWSSRRAILVLTMVAVLGVAFLVQHVNAQQKAVRQKKGLRPPPVMVLPGKGGPPMPGVGPKKEAYDLGQLTLPKDEDLKEMLDAAEDNIRAAVKAGREKQLRVEAESYNRACQTLQEKLIGRSRDVFVP